MPYIYLSLDLHTTETNGSRIGRVAHFLQTVRRIPNKTVGRKLKTFVGCPTMVAGEKEILSISCISLDVDVALWLAQI